MLNNLRVDSIVALTVGKCLATKRQCIHLHVPLHAEFNFQNVYEQ